MKHICNMTIGLVASMILASGAGKISAADQPPGPEGLAGFSGQVRGVVVEKGEKGVITFKVGRVLKTWKNNKAERPEALKGRTVPVGPRWVQEGEGGKWQPVERHVRFLRTLEPGAELTLEICHAEREHFAILELSEEQRQRADRSGQDRRERAGDREQPQLEAEIVELRREIERLKAENRELRERR
jgi:hypothetical protein